MIMNVKNVYPGTISQFSFFDGRIQFRSNGVDL